MNRDQDNTVDRRRLLRRAGTVAAGLAGAGVTAAATAASAEADPGDPVLQGADNDAGSATTLRSSSDTATLRLANAKVTTGPNGKALTAPTLRLAPNGTGLSAQAEIGSIGMDTTGTIWAASGNYRHYGFVDRVHTSANSNRIVPVIPQRVLDTRTPQGRVNIHDPGGLAAPGDLDSTGRLLGGRTIEVTLAGYVFIADAVFGNVTVTGSVAGSFLQIFPAGLPRPTSFSTINFETNQTVSNAFMSGVNWSTDRISIYAARTTHVIIDVVAFVIGFGEVYPQILLPHEGWTPQATSQAEVARQRRPSWEQDD
ncbi:hypothetical protein F8271_19355 [Micromonospora sp. ALFpr18c]|uniref:hypothetical protein n=1 Tax=unclassified Micromonospora TaxID=2617518 RepID=UPI00124B9001|nr:hypothetical protein [Micromonospora sp. ALFpr18c]KAB1937337.1 hypothetical protein F8271_19355 [Micromonospora sp. ALFpr18c]